MAPKDDVETPAGTNEQTPLLVETPPTEHTRLLADEESVHADQTPVSEDETQKEARKASWYIWRGFWLIIAALVLAAFIKGWIDAGSDVNVSFTSDLQQTTSGQLT